MPPALSTLSLESSLLPEAPAPRSPFYNHLKNLLKFFRKTTPTNPSKFHQYQLNSGSEFPFCKGQLQLFINTVWTRSDRSVRTQLLPIRVLANTSASDPLVPLPSPWESVEDADEDVDDPWTDRLIQDSAFCKLWCNAAERAAWRLSEPSSSEAEDVSVWKQKENLAA